MRIGSLRIELVWMVAVISGVGGACKSDDNPSGDAAGSGFQVADSVSASVTDQDGSSVARIVIASTPGLCADAAAMPPVDRAGQKFIVIELADVSGAMTATPTVPGTYEIYPNTGTRPAKSASFVTGAFDGSCVTIDEADASGQSGTVTLASNAGDVFAGSYDVMLNTGIHIAGQFAPKACAALRDAAASTGPHTCAPTN
jgi:hypothetical protein